MKRTRLTRPDGATRNANAQRSGAGWVSARDRLHGRVVGRRSVVEMAPEIIAIRWLTDEGGAQPRVASKRVGDLPRLRVRARASIFIAAETQPRLASKRIRGLPGAAYPGARGD